jgi:hypothetical protein
VKWMGILGPDSGGRRPGRRRIARARFGYLPAILALCLGLGLAASESAGASVIGPRVPDATAASTSPRIGVLTNAGSFLVKQGALNAPWTTEATDVIAGSVSGNLIAVLTNAGTFQVKQGSLTASWTTEATDVRAGVVSAATSTTPLRIGVLTNAGTFLVKQGGLTAPWTTEATDVTAGAISGNLIGTLTNAGTFQVKQGGLNASWTTEATDVRAGTIWSAT